MYDSDMVGMLSRLRRDASSRAFSPDAIGIAELKKHEEKETGLLHFNKKKSNFNH